jgi:CheY-like chemotaxis protein
MSHEIRTPMNAVIGFSELLSSLVTDKKQKSYLNSIQTAGKALLTLINDILDLSKIEAGRFSIQYEAVNPYTLFNELKQIFAVKIADKNLEFIVDIDKELPKALLLDEVRVRQVLLNLLGNAIKFTNTGYIKLSVRYTPNLIEKSEFKKKSDFFNSLDLIIAVTDTGIGIPVEQQALVFESFRQQDGQSTRKYEGTGLGLAITKRLVEMMNGEISLKSAVGKGSIFEITLRDVDVSTTALTESPLNDLNYKNISFEKAFVLVVDDIESNRTLIKECLSCVNLDVVEAEDGQIALIFAEEYHPALILMDLKMPELDGYEASQQLKANPNICDIPIIALTASVTVSEQAKIKAHGFDGYLSKPVNIDNLFQELSRYLKPIEKSAISVTEAPVKDDSMETQPFENIVELPVLRQTLFDKMLPAWQDLIEIMEMEAIEEFAKQLIQLGEKHQAQHLIDYADNLRELVEDFDIEAVERALEAFHDIVEALRL